MTIKQRTILLNDKKPDKDAKCVIYVMSRDIRLADNHALLAAQQSALESNLPLLIMFNVLPLSGSRSKEHYEFMLSGVKEVSEQAKDLNIGFLLTFGSLIEQIKITSDKVRPKEIFFDFSPLRGPREVQNKIAGVLDCRVSVVDTHNIIPIWVTSDKEEFAAHTIRSKIHKNLESWTVEPEAIVRHPFSLKMSLSSLMFADVLDQIKCQDAGININYIPGERAALKSLDKFIDETLGKYAESRNNPNIDGQSNLSPYPHFGNVSSLRVVMELLKHINETPLLFKEPRLASYNGKPTFTDSVDALIEELVVRKELSDNYCLYNMNYDNFEGAKDWAKASLITHQDDVRQFVYSTEDLENANTHDNVWNAAQLQMTKTAKMHGYMRMYWAKKILEWSESPAQAISKAIYLNDKFSIDGGDPNGYTGIMWSTCGVHDRPWFERPIFGKIRYMNYEGLKRKFDVEKYIEKMDKVKPGDYVAWRWLNGVAEGVIEEVHIQKTTIVSKGKIIVRNGNKDNPALVISHKSGNKVLKLLNEVQVTG